MQICWAVGDEETVYDYCLFVTFCSGLALDFVVVFSAVGVLCVPINRAVFFSSEISLFMQTVSVMSYPAAWKKESDRARPAAVKFQYLTPASPTRLCENKVTPGDEKISYLSQLSRSRPISEYMFKG